jgi:hypothetical protein
VPEGRVKLRYEFEPNGAPNIAKGKGAPGRGKLYINDTLTGQVDFPYTVPLAISLGSGLSVGRNPGSAVSRLYRPPFAFTGTIFKVTADVSGQNQNAEEDKKAAFQRAMSSQ